MTMPKTNPLKSIAAAVAMTTAAWATTAVAADDARQAWQVLDAQGYTAIYELKREHGLWTAKGTTLDGNRVQLLLDGNNQLLEVGRPELNQQLATSQQVVQHLQNAGYRRIHDVEFDDGFWEVEAYNAAGFEVDLVLHPITLEVLSEVIDGQGQASSWNETGLLSATEVRSALERAGYSRIHDLDFDDGFWEADATNANGQRVELRIDPRTGAVLREKLDD